MPGTEQQQAAIKVTGLGSPDNGMPESGGYTYRGTGRDTMPWAILDPDPAEDSRRRYNRIARPPGQKRPHRRRCRDCGHTAGSGDCRTACGP